MTLGQKNRGLHGRGRNEQPTGSHNPFMFGCYIILDIEPCVCVCERAYKDMEWEVTV